jgi:hypothetical protein
MNKPRRFKQRNSVAQKAAVGIANTFNCEKLKEWDQFASRRENNVTLDSKDCVTVWIGFN